MPKNKEKNNSNKKFIYISLIILTLFAITVFFIFPLAFPKKPITLAENNNNETSKKGTFYINDKYNEDDPLLTIIPDLKDMITGPIITEADPAIGPNDAKINIVAYTDFECSYCYRAINEIKTIQQEMPDTIKFIHKDFPINNSDTPSFQAAVAGRCADEQGKFWEMAEELYKNGDNLTEEVFSETSKKIDLNQNTFKNCLNSDKAKNLVLDNIKEANALRIIGIPLFYINDQEILGEVDYDEFKKIIEKELNK